MSDHELIQRLHSALMHFDWRTLNPTERAFVENVDEDYRRYLQQPKVQPKGDNNGK